MWENIKAFFVKLWGERVVPFIKKNWVYVVIAGVAFIAGLIVGR